jgi:ribose transport system substrate-binding protein
MSKRIWVVGVIVLIGIFGYILTQFLSSTLTIERLIHQLEEEANRNHNQNQPVKHVVLIAQELDNPFWRTVEQGAKEAAAQLGMEIEYTGPIRIHPEGQIKLLEKAIASKPDAILAQGMNDLQFNELVGKAIDQNIPVVAVDSDAPNSRRLAYVGTNNIEAGRQMGKMVVQDADRKGKIGIIIGSEFADNQKLRLEGFLSVIQHSQGFEVADIRSSNISRIEAASQTKTMLSQHPGITVMIGFSAWDAVGIAEGLQAQDHGEISVFGFDDVEATRRAINRGDVAASIVQQPKAIGYEAVTMLQRIFDGKSYPVQQHTGTKVLVK